MFFKEADNARWSTCLFFSLTPTFAKDPIWLLIRIFPWLPPNSYWEFSPRDFFCGHTFLLFSTLILFNGCSYFPFGEMIKFSMLAFVVSPSKIKRKFLRVLLCVLFRSSFSTGPIWMWSGIRPCLIRSLIFFTLCRWSAAALCTLNIQAHVNPDAESRYSKLGTLFF